MLLRRIAIHRHFTLAAGLAAVLAIPPARALAADGVPVCTAAHDQFGVVSVPDPTGGAYVAWLDQRLGYNTDVVLQRLDERGARRTGWPADGANVTYVTCSKTEVALAADSLGVLAVWADDRCSSAIGFDVYVQRTTPAGAAGAGWPVNGRLVRSAAGDQLHPAIASDGAGGAFVAWTDVALRPASVWAQHVRADGTVDPAWPAAGRLLASNVPDSSRVSIVPDGGGGALLAWEDTRSSNADLFVQHLAADGATAPGWPANGAVLVAVAGDQYAPQLIADGAGGAFATWCDHRAGSVLVYARRVTGAGASAPGWPADGTPVASAAGEQVQPCAITDGAGGIVLAWQDFRAGSADVYAQRVAGDGTTAAGWPAAGLALCTAAGAQGAPALALDGAGGVYAAWLDARASAVSGTDVYATRVAPSATVAPGWPADGAPVCDVPGEQREVRLVASGSGGALVAWTDGRARATRGDDVACSTLSPAAPASVQARDLAVRHHDGQTFVTWTAPPGSGWTYRVYRSATPMSGAGDLAGAVVVGTVGDSSACDRHLSQEFGVPFGYAIDSLETPLDPAQGLLVHTPGASATAWYAVTSQNGLFAENTALVPGANTLTTPVSETLEAPRPVYQRDLEVNFVHPRIWTLFVSDHDTPLLRAMGNRPGLAYDCAVVSPPPSTQSSLLVPLHYRLGSLLDGIYGTGTNGEWVLGLDDWLPSGENTYWYGYADTYDVTSANPAPPTSGTVVDYTLRRIAFTLDWTLRTFPIDRTRVYAFGYSMGGEGATLVATHLGDRFASVMSVVGKVNFAFLDDPDTTCWFNPSGSVRKVTNALWGKVATNLPSSEGAPAYQVLDDGWLAANPASRPIPPIITFVGKLDVSMGWAENPPFWRAMEDNRRGGSFYWEMRHHNEPVQTQWSPIEDPRYLYRFKLDRSFPAVSHCSLDGDPGDGRATSGDSLGSINGAIEWDLAPVDSVARWSVGIHLRTLATYSRSIVPPDSCTLDVTPRRTQAFFPPPGEPVTWQVRKSAGGALVQSGTVLTGADGTVTIPGVRVYRTGSVLDLRRTNLTAVPAAGVPVHAGISASRNPARGRVTLVVAWPGAGEGRIDVFDVGGRVVRTPYRGPAAATAVVPLETSGLPPGLYLVRARAEGRAVSTRLVVLP